MAHLFQQRKTILTFSALIDDLRELMRQFPDKRTGNNSVYQMEDVALAAFSVFFTQSPSFLAHQIAMTTSRGLSNAQTLFGLSKIPSDNHIRDLLDHVPASRVFPMFDRIVDALHQQGHLQAFQALGGQLLIALDGTQYHNSQSIHCNQCTVTQHRNGQTTYSHSVVTPVIVAPGQRCVLPLAPEFIMPQDGHQKQDCENSAAKRWIIQYAKSFQQHQITVLGDDLYSRQTLCEQVLAAGWNFLFVCKPTSHKTLYEWLEELEALGAVHTLTRQQRKGKRKTVDIYRFASGLPLRDGDDALAVNWCELVTTDDKGKVLYRNAFVSNHAIDADNVVTMVQAARTRWKVENESNNTLKTKGYHLAHNFGHGKQHLSTTLATLNLLAFLLHTVLDTMDKKYQLIRATLPSRKMFFQHIQALTSYLCFDSFDALLDFMMQGWELTHPDTS